MVPTKMTLVFHAATLFLEVLALVSGGYGVHQKLPQLGDRDDHGVIHDASPSHPSRPERSPGEVSRQWANVPQDDSYLIPEMDIWMMEHPALLEMESPHLIEETRSLYNPSFRGRHPDVLLENSHNPAESLVKPYERHREEIPLHPFRSLESPYDVPQDDIIIHPLWQLGNPYDPQEDVMGFHDQPVEKFTTNPWKPLYVRPPNHRDSTIDPRDFEVPRLPSKRQLTRTVPSRWNEFVVNCIIKLRFGGDDVFDMSEFSWIQGLEFLSQSMIEDLLTWDQPDGSAVLVPKLLIAIDFSDATLKMHGKWEVLNLFKDNSLEMHTVPLSIVRLFRDTLKPVQVQPIRTEPEEYSWYDLEDSPDSFEQSRGVPFQNRHAFDFREYNDYDFIPNKELPKKDPVLLGRSHV